MSQKKIIKLTSSQIQLMTLKNLKIHLNKPVIYSTKLKENTSLPLQQKACGLFNPINNNANIDADGNGKTNDFIEINDKQNDEKNNKKINEINLIDNFNRAAQNLDFFNEEMEDNLNLEDQNLIDFFPSNDSMQFDECLEQISPLAINSTNNSNIQTEHDNSNVMTLDLSFNNNNLISSQDQQHQDQEINDPFLNDFLLSHEHVLNQEKSIDHEHLYASKRQLEEDQDVEEKQKKKQRVKGIYRAKDVKTEQDLENYIERRVKNNKSSKISRSNKKNHYNQMEQKSDQLEQENKILKEIIEKMQTNISSIKSFLISNLNQC